MTTQGAEPDGDAAGVGTDGAGERRQRVPDGDIPRHEPHHRSVQGGGARAAVFGINDGLVSNVSLILGMAGAHAAAGTVRLAGVAGLIAGACSMAAGEYVSMRAQSELMQRELDVERRALQRQPTLERRELAAIYERRGVEPEMARELADRMMRDPDVALETHAREELGINPEELGNPYAAAGSSFVMFSIGAFIPLLPWILTGGALATWLAVGLGAAASLTVGAVLAAFTGRRWAWSAVRQLLVSAVAAGATYGIGHLIGTGAAP